MKKKLKKAFRAKKVKKIKETEVISLYYTASKYIVPRLRKFNKICMSHPSNETYESWQDKINYVANSLEARTNKKYYSLKWDEQQLINENAKKASKLLGEIWFDLWS
jgi:hypothetical protein